MQSSVTLNLVLTCAGVAGEDVVKGWDRRLDSSTTVGEE